jgi:hypothetical protein
MLQRISKRWSGFCIVAAPGPSLTEEVAEACKGYHVVAVNDAWRRLPFAEVLYAGDSSWWEHYRGVPEFKGEKWSAHGDRGFNDKRMCWLKHGLKLVRGRAEAGFSSDTSTIHYGDNSGFQAINLAALMLGFAGRIALVGFDMRAVEGRRHFFGEHPPELRSTRTGYSHWPAKFAEAAKSLPDGLEIVNCTPGSALRCFPMRELSETLPPRG